MMQCRNNNNNALKLIIWYSSNHQSVFESINPLQWNYFLNFPKTKKYISGIFVKIKIFEKLLSEIQFQSLELFSLVEASVFFYCIVRIWIFGRYYVCFFFSVFETKSVHHCHYKFQQYFYILNFKHNYFKHIKNGKIIS